jgi:hypothetical protein
VTGPASSPESARDQRDHEEQRLSFHLDGHRALRPTNIFNLPPSLAFHLFLTRPSSRSPALSRALFLITIFASHSAMLRRSLPHPPQPLPPPSRWSAPRTTLLHPRCRKDPIGPRSPFWSG